MYSDRMIGIAGMSLGGFPSFDSIDKLSGKKKFGNRTKIEKVRD